MREIVVDASVAAKWVVEEEHSQQAAQLLTAASLHAPAHWRAEAANVLWVKVFRGDLTPDDAKERTLVLNRAPVTDTAIAILVPRAFTIAVTHSITVYDALYVALAEQRDVECVSADVKLIRRLSSDRDLRRRMVWIGDQGSP